MMRKMVKKEINILKPKVCVEMISQAYSNSADDDDDDDDDGDHEAQCGGHMPHEYTGSFSELIFGAQITSASQFAHSK